MDFFSTWEHKKLLKGEVGKMDYVLVRVEKNNVKTNQQGTLVTRTNNPWEQLFTFPSLHVHTNQTLLLSFPFELGQLEKKRRKTVVLPILVYYFKIY